MLLTNYVHVTSWCASICLHC